MNHGKNIYNTMIIIFEYSKKVVNNRNKYSSNYWTYTVVRFLFSVKTSLGNKSLSALFPRNLLQDNERNKSDAGSKCIYKSQTSVSATNIVFRTILKCLQSKWTHCHIWIIYCRSSGMLIYAVIQGCFSLSNVNS